MKSDKRTYVRVNEGIRCSNMRLIDEVGKQLGIKTLSESLALAKEKALDLVEIAPQADPPVGRIMDYGKFRYEQTRKEKLAKKKQHNTKLKEIKLTPRIDKHDYEIKVSKVMEFLGKGNKVKISCRFRGREIQHKEFGEERIKRLVEDVAELGAMEGGAKMQGRNLSIIISPKSSSH